MLHQGPFDGHMMGINSKGDMAPTKIRVASGDDGDDPLEVHEYRRDDDDQSGVIWMGSYKFTHSFESARSLVDYFV